MPLVLVAMTAQGRSSRRRLRRRVGPQPEEGVWRHPTRHDLRRLHEIPLRNVVELPDFDNPVVDEFPRGAHVLVAAMAAGSAHGAGALPQDNDVL